MHELAPEINEIECGSFKLKNPPEIMGSSYVVKSLEAALWAFYNSDTFEKGCLMAVNLEMMQILLGQFMVNCWSLLW